MSQEGKSRNFVIKDVYEWKRLSEVRAPRPVSTEGMVQPPPGMVYKRFRANPSMLKAKPPSTRGQNTRPNELLPFEATRDYEYTADLPYIQQGSSKYYSMESLQTREELSKDPFIIAEIEKYWRTNLDNLDRLKWFRQRGGSPQSALTGNGDATRSTTSESLTKASRRHIPIESYGMLLVRMAKALHSNFSKDKAFQLAIDDCARDRGKKTASKTLAKQRYSLWGCENATISHRKFRKGLFQLVDIWTDSLSRSSYLMFLKVTIRIITYCLL